jgi:hypothetical protein
VICSYLNKVFGWGPPDVHSQAHIEQILAVVADGVGDGRLAFHPVNFYASHKTQASSGLVCMSGDLLCTCKRSGVSSVVAVQRDSLLVAGN